MPLTCEQLACTCDDPLLPSVPVGYALPPEQVSNGGESVDAFSGTVSGRYSLTTRYKWGWGPEYLSGTAPANSTNRRWAQWEHKVNFVAASLLYLRDDAGVPPLDATRRRTASGSQIGTLTAICPQHNANDVTGWTAIASGAMTATVTTIDFPGGGNASTSTYAGTAASDGNPAGPLLYWSGDAAGFVVVATIGTPTITDRALGAGWRQVWPANGLSGYTNYPNEDPTAYRTQDSWESVTLSSEVTMRKVYNYALTDYFAADWTDISSVGAPRAALVDNRGSDAVGHQLKMGKARYTVGGSVASADHRRTFVAYWSEVTGSADFSTLTQVPSGRSANNRECAVTLAAGETTLTTPEYQLGFPPGLTDDRAPQLTTIVRGPRATPTFVPVFNATPCPPKYRVRMTLAEAATAEYIGLHVIRWDELRIDLTTGAITRIGKYESVAISSAGQTELLTSEYTPPQEPGIVYQPHNFRCDTTFFYAAPRWRQV